MVVTKGRVLITTQRGSVTHWTANVHVTREQLELLRGGSELVVRVGDRILRAEIFSYIGFTPGGMRRVVQAAGSEVSDAPNARHVVAMTQRHRSPDGRRTPDERGTPDARSRAV